MRAHTPHPRAPNPEQTARQKACWLSHSPGVTEFRTSLVGLFCACGAPERRGDPARAKKKSPQASWSSPGRNAASGEAVVCGGRARP